MVVEGNRPRGRPRKKWMKTLEDDMTRCALSPADTKNRSLWRGRIHGAKTANLGKPGYTIGVLTNGSVVKPTCVFAC
jgi:hypothetical protein